METKEENIYEPQKLSGCRDSPLGFREKGN
jgi:hypothetical protein